MANVARFWEWVDQSGGHDACWPWRGGVNSHGYGQVYVGKTEGRKYPTYRGAHRLALELRHGITLTREQFACHHCDNPPCCNPAHLYVGDKLTNPADKGRRRRGRSSAKQGASNNMAKLTEGDVRSLRAAVAAGATQASQAARYGLSTGTVSQIVNRHRWPHLD